MLPEFTLAVCRIAIGAAFGASSVGKILNYKEFTKSFAIMNILPNNTNRGLPPFVITVEFILSLMLFSGISLVFSFIVSFFTLNIFSYVIFVSIKNNFSATCNCFGKAKALNGYDIVRNSGFAVIAASGWGVLAAHEGIGSQLSITEWGLAGIVAVTLVIALIWLGDIAQLLQDAHQ